MLPACVPTQWQSNSLSSCTSASVEGGSLNHNEKLYHRQTGANIVFLCVWCFTLAPSVGVVAHHSVWGGRWNSKEKVLIATSVFLWLYAQGTVTIEAFAYSREIFASTVCHLDIFIVACKITWWISNIIISFRVQLNIAHSNMAIRSQWFEETLKPQAVLSKYLELDVISLTSGLLNKASSVEGEWKGRSQG